MCNLTMFFSQDFFRLYCLVFIYDSFFIEILQSILLIRTFHWLLSSKEPFNLEVSDLLPKYSSLDYSEIER